MSLPHRHVFAKLARQFVGIPQTPAVMRDGHRRMGIAGAVAELIDSRDRAAIPEVGREFLGS